MKSSQLLFLALSGSLLFSACKKDDSNNQTNSEIEVSKDMAKDAGISESLLSDSYNLLAQVSTENNLDGNGFAPSSSTDYFIPCASVTVTPQQGFPKNIVIDFGTSCTHNGVTRSGKILVTLTDSLRHTGSQAIMTFDNYVVQGFHKTGTITWTNQSTATQKIWQRNAQQVKFSLSNNLYWIHNGTQYIEQTAGVSTPINPLDDVWTMTGTSTTTNANGVTRSHTILIPLEKKFVCNWIGKGSIKTQGPNHNVVLDYGDGTCDNNATLSVDGGTPFNITL